MKDQAASIRAAIFSMQAVERMNSKAKAKKAEAEKEDDAEDEGED